MVRSTRPFAPIRPFRRAQRARGRGLGEFGEPGQRAAERLLGRSAGTRQSFLVVEVRPVVGVGDAGCARRRSGSSAQRHRCPIGAPPGSAGIHAMSRPSSNSTTWFSRTAPLVMVMVNTSPTARTRWPPGASDRLSLPSQRGCCAGSAINSKIAAAGAAMSRLALTILGFGHACHHAAPSRDEQSPRTRYRDVILEPPRHPALGGMPAHHGVRQVDDGSGDRVDGPGVGRAVQAFGQLATPAPPVARSSRPACHRRRRRARRPPDRAGRSDSSSRASSGSSRANSMAATPIATAASTGVSPVAAIARTLEPLERAQPGRHEHTVAVAEPVIQGARRGAAGLGDGGDARRPRPARRAPVPASRPGSRRFHASAEVP